MDIGCYYFPNYHAGDPRNERQHGAGWSEWELVKRAVPRYPGHRQPRRPLWGWGDEKSPEVMARKIDAAADAGIGFFIFDWYYYDDGPFLERALEEGFLRAPNRSRLKFCTMWANHNWTDIHPATRFSPRRVLYPGAVSRATFEKIVEVHLTRYFPRAEYYCIDGCPYFSIYDLEQFLNGMGGVAEARRALEDFRMAAKSAGFPGVHLNAVSWKRPLLPGEGVHADLPSLLGRLSFDSATSYVWIHHAVCGAPLVRYDDILRQYLSHWEQALREYPCEYYPNLSVGWDSSPRLAPSEVWDGGECGGYPCGPAIRDASPEGFGRALRLIRARLEGLPQRHKILNINSWNEWTESSYLEPDDVWGTGYLDTLRAELAAEAAR